MSVDVERQAELPVLNVEELLGTHVNRGVLGSFGEMANGKTTMILNALYQVSPFISDLVIFTVNTGTTTQSPLTSVVQKEAFQTANAKNISSYFANLFDSLRKSFSSVDDVITQMYRLDLLEISPGTIPPTIEDFNERIVLDARNSLQEPDLQQNFDSFDNTTKLAFGLSLWCRKITSDPSYKLVQALNMYREATTIPGDLAANLRERFGDDSNAIQKIFYYLYESMHVPMVIFDDCTDLWTSEDMMGREKKDYEIYDTERKLVTNTNCSGKSAIRRTLTSIFTRGRHFLYTYFVLHKFQGVVSDVSGQLKQMSYFTYDKNSIPGIARNMQLSRSSLTSIMDTVDNLKQEVRESTGISSSVLDKMYHPMVVNNPIGLRVTDDQLVTMRENVDDGSGPMGCVFRSFRLTKQHFIDQSMVLFEPYKGTPEYDKLVSALQPSTSATGLEFSPILVGSPQYRLMLINQREIAENIRLEHREAVQRDQELTRIAEGQSV